MDTSYSINVDAPRMTPQELAAPRPERPEFPGRYFDADALVTQQRQWDRASSERQRLAAWVADNRAKEATAAKRKEDERDAVALAKRTEARADLEAKLKREFMGQPGVDENDWQRLKGQVIDNHLLAQSGAADDVARADMARRTREAY